jgi:hypothetical protein
MSIYSGFATRQQESYYNKLIEGLITILTKRVLKFYKTEKCDEGSFCVSLCKIANSMAQLESNKYLDPKYSTQLLALTEYVKSKKF